MSKKTLILTIILTIMSAGASEKSVYDFSWLDPDKEVYVLQNRKFQKNKRLHLSAGYGQTLTGPFVKTSILQGRASLFLTEQFGVEFLYSKNSGENNDTYNAVTTNYGSGSTIPFRRIVEQYYGGSIVWSPFYTKINTFNKIIYVDWMFSLGYGQLKEHNNTNAVVTNGVNTLEKSETHGTILWGTTFKVFLSRYVDIRIDLTGAVYRAERPGPLADPNPVEATYFNYDLTFSLGIALF